MAWHRRSRSVVGGTVVALVVGSGLATAPMGAVAAPAVPDGRAVAASSSSPDGSLDRSFAGVGYRVLPPTPGVSDGTGHAVLLTDTGRLRTLVKQAVAEDTMVLRARGWTIDGWVDRAFYRGGTKTSHTFTSTDLINTGATGQGSISVATTGWESLAITAERFGSDGRTVARTVIPKPLDGEDGGEYYTLDSTGLLPTGEMVVVRFPSTFGSTLEFYDADFRKVRSTHVTHWVTGFPVAGPHLWATGYGFATRMSLAGAVDPGWGGDGVIDGVARFAGHASGAGYGVAGQGALSVRRLVASGEVDVAFGKAGNVGVGGSGPLLAGRTTSLKAMRATAKGLLLSLQLRTTGSDEPWRYRLIRIGLDGQLDPSFGSGGIVRSTGPITAITHDAKGRIYTLSTSSTGDVTLARRTG
jgi:hypothetical protein